MQNRPSKDKILVLLTDGEDLEGNALAAAKAAAKDGLKIYTVGVGTANGDLIPIPAEQGGGFVKDESGQFVKSHLDEAGLKAIAEATGGLYAPLGAQGQGLDTIYQQALAPLAKHDLASRRQKGLHGTIPVAAGGITRVAARQHAHRHAAPHRAKERSAGGGDGTARPQLHGATARRPCSARMLFLPFSHAQASTATAEKAYQKGDFATAEREYAAAAQRDPKKPDLQFNAGTAAYKAGQFPQAAEAFQKSLGGEPSADPKRLAAQEDAYYDLGNTLYRTGQKTEQSNPQQTIQTWEQAVKTYDAALQLRANDADAKYNRDFVKRKLEELKKKQEQQQQQTEQQNKNRIKKTRINRTSQDRIPTRRTSRIKTRNRINRISPVKIPRRRTRTEQRPESRTSRINPVKSPRRRTRKTKTRNRADSKPDQQKDQQQANSGSKPDQQKQPDQQGQQPKPANGQPQGNAQAQAGADQRKDEAAQAADSQREPGQMSKDGSARAPRLDERRRTPSSGRAGRAQRHQRQPPGSTHQGLVI